MSPSSPVLWRDDVIMGAKLLSAQLCVQPTRSTVRLFPFPYDMRRWCGAWRDGSSDGAFLSHAYLLYNIQYIAE